eukprot:SAG31_NODE_12_length_38498_cov_21.161671_24_plen_195_part_00
MSRECALLVRLRSKTTAVAKVAKSAHKNVRISSMSASLTIRFCMELWLPPPIACEPASCSRDPRSVAHLCTIEMVIVAMICDISGCLVPHVTTLELNLVSCALSPAGSALPRTLRHRLPSIRDAVGAVVKSAALGYPIELEPRDCSRGLAACCNGEDELLALVPMRATSSHCLLTIGRSLTMDTIRFRRTNTKH